VNPVELQAAAEPARTSPWQLAIVCLLGTSFLAAFVILQTPEVRHQTAAGFTDFLSFYVGARLIGSPEMYSREANLRLQDEFAGAHSDPLVYARPPFYALLLRPFAALPYHAAYVLFQIFNLGCALAAIWLFARRMGKIAILASMSLPLITMILQGQDVGIVAFLYAVFYRLSERGRGFAAGLSLSLCLIKFHFFPLTVLALALRREWIVLRGAFTGGSILIAFSFVAGGAHWPAAYWAVLRDPTLDPLAKVMPNLHGMVAALGWPSLVEGILAGAVVLAFAAIVLGGCPRAVAYSLALAGGLLLSYHAYLYDALLLLVALGILGSAADALTTGLLEISVTPIPCVLLLPGNRWTAVLPGLLMAMFASSVFALFRSRESRLSPTPPPPPGTPAPRG
jgi:hypothetical protein